MLKHFQLQNGQWSIFLEIKGIIMLKEDDVEIESSLSFLTKDFFYTHIKDRPYVKLKDNLWAIKSGNKYLVDDFDGVDELVENLKKEVVYDFLTQCYNKKETEILVEKFLKESIRYNTPLSIMMLDIDHFKRINDTYGHLAGDYVLKEVAKTIKNSIRQSDICGRFGGEEFLIALPNTKLSGAMKLAERIRKTIEEGIFNFENYNIKVTLSIGITSASKSDSLFSLIERADEALYEAKKKGRNRIEYR